MDEKKSYRNIKETCRMFSKLYAHYTSRPYTRHLLKRYIFHSHFEIYLQLKNVLLIALQPYRRTLSPPQDPNGKSHQVFFLRIVLCVFLCADYCRHIIAPPPPTFRFVCVYLYYSSSTTSFQLLSTRIPVLLLRFQRAFSEGALEA